MADAQTIELDCPPGSPRPGDLYPQVIRGTGLETREPVSKWFGEWTWDYSDVDPEVWASVRLVLKGRITDLYHAGLIRWGSWQGREISQEAQSGDSRRRAASEKLLDAAWAGPRAGRGAL